MEFLFVFNAVTKKETERSMRRQLESFKSQKNQD